ncbi:MAG: hypothetical protein UR66_C0001G0114 [Candidatus Moranbacteria bacterium GW2011_GWE1_35_17]|nr:MAG: hypothetical protein UR66_C0001G0114 [Candidatus Moranbacteria bacterium GW2011_GWE1_35_17]KKP85166.1 MAG: hypothetical protein UR83_C0003G0001 [Candidatus Moranbacteria bacterium GW2011_GWF2_35_54]OGS62828.1 MAG: hypothetical protein A2X07_10910 [Flavobacteria bacterium GWF1_32_7]
MGKKRKHKKLKKNRRAFAEKIFNKENIEIEKIKSERSWGEKIDKKIQEVKFILAEKIKGFQLNKLEGVEAESNIQKESAREFEKPAFILKKEISQKFKRLRYLFLDIARKIKTKQRKISGKMMAFYQKTIPTLKKWNNIFCTGMVCKTNIKRDVYIIGAAIFIAATTLALAWYPQLLKSKSPEKPAEVALSKEELDYKFEQENILNISTIQENIDSSNWKEYKSLWYGFKIKYPQSWKAPLVQPYSRISKAGYRVSFIANEQENKNFIGFDVAVYDIARVKEFFQTDEFPKLKDESSKDAESCKNIEGHMIETGDYPAEEIYIPQEDDCYNPALFFTVVKGQYIYNIAPRLKVGATINNDSMVAVSDNLPEFFAAVSSFENIDIVRPRPKPVAPKITAPKPASYKIEGGRLVCEKKNDKPGKSDKGKGKHMDMECCLDPDEYPNPNCYYDPAKYGKYLK